MELQKHVIERFVSDHKLPIQVTEEPYFSYYLRLYDKDFDTKSKLEMLYETLSKYKSQQEFLDEFYRIRDEIITTLKSTDAYKNFIESNNPDFVKTKTSTPKYDGITECCGVRFSKKSDVYSCVNDGKYFLSIDLAKANFQVLKKYDKDIVFGAETYEELISKFTDLEYVKTSKYIREVIFGNLNCGRQISMQKYYTAKLLEWLIENKYVSVEDVAVFTNDELVIRKESFVEPEKCEELKKLIKEGLDLDVSVESFKLKMIGDKEYFAKELSTGKTKFKAIPAAYYAQVYKKYYNLPITDYDLIFLFEKKIAKFIKPVI